MLSFYSPHITSFIAGISLLFFSVTTAASDASQSQRYAPKSFTSDHKISINRKKVNYTATASETLIKNDSGEAIASIWSTAYTVKTDNKKRPVTFVFNGGPGAAGAIMQMGFLGPKIVQIPNAPIQDDGAAPYTLINNPNSILDLTDIVFVDPVGTGYSRAVGEGQNSDFWSMAVDTSSMSAFIREWITTHERWNTPKYLLGLSYGTTRSVTVADHLLNKEGIAVNGLILLGPALDFISLSPLKGNLMSRVYFMPSMAAVAHYHKKAKTNVSLADFVEEARQFTANEYAPALLREGQLTQQEKNTLAARLSYFTGLNADYILKSHFKINIPRYRKELLRDEGLTVGLSDGRYTGDEVDDLASDPLMQDPAAYNEMSAYTALLQHYMTKDLGISVNRKYHLWNTSVGKYWDWRPDVSAYSNPKQYRIAKRTGRIEVISTLSKTLIKNDDMKVLVGTGYYDLVTPFFDAERTFYDTSLPQDKINIEYYKSGHRLWRNNESRVKLVKDIRTFLTEKE